MYKPRSSASLHGPSHPNRHAWILAIALLASGVLLQGCTPLTEPLERGQPARSAPTVKEILADLAENDAALRTIHANGTVTLKSPDSEAVRQSKSSRVFFRRPQDLYIEGRKMGSILFRLRCRGSEFLIDFPATRDEPYYRVEGEQFRSVDFSVSPADIAREMFLPEAWAEVKRKDVRLTSYDAGAQRAILLLGPEDRPRRVMHVVGPPWVVTYSERLDEAGVAVAVTHSTDHVVKDGVRFPSHIETEFPGEETWIKFDVRDFWPNTVIPEDRFDIKAHALEAGIDVNR